MELINGRKIREDILERVRREVAALPFQPVFTDVLVGEDPASMQYVRMKAKTAESVGIKFHNAAFPAGIATEDLAAEIRKLNAVPHMCGIIVQLPLPAGIDQRAVLDAIDPALDVDCLGTSASDKFYAGDTSLGFPTALACMAILDSLALDLSGKKIVVLGQGTLVGKPVAALLRFRGLEPVPVTRKVENREALIKEADVIISGIGAGKFLTGGMVKPGVIIVDAGTSESPSGPPAPDQPGGRAGIVGDVDQESVAAVAAALSPVPGGVGPVTVAMLLVNVLEVAKRKNQRP